MSSEIHKTFGPLFERDAAGLRGEGARPDRGAVHVSPDPARRSRVPDGREVHGRGFVLRRWSDQVGIDLPLWPNLADYQERVLLRPSVIEALDAERIPVRHVFRHSA